MDEKESMVDVGEKDVLYVPSTIDWEEISLIH